MKRSLLALCLMVQIVRVAPHGEDADREREQPGRCNDDERHDDRESLRAVGGAPERRPCGEGLARIEKSHEDRFQSLLKNMEELLWRGDSLDSALGPAFVYRASRKLTPTSQPGMSHLSTSLRTESEKYRQAARNINLQALLRQYAPVAAVAFLVLILLWWRFG
jgi:hypothetical protein